MQLQEIKNSETPRAGSKVIHTETLEVGTVARAALSPTKLIVDFPLSPGYPAPKRNIRLIVQE
jgi:hypothetical protein